MKSVSSATVKRARELMSDGLERSVPDLARALSLTDTAGWNAMGALHDMRLVYISRYERVQGATRWRRIYRFGRKPDAKPPEKSPKNAYLVREREWLEKSRVPVKPHRHWQDAALFGEYRGTAA